MSQLPDPAAAWALLRAGNQRFVAGQRELPNQDGPRRAALVGGQSPFALVVGCSDSRVPPEIIFDRGLGDLFVVRTAGHVADGSVLGSVEYGVLVLGIRLVVVLGHDQCGAVQATIQAYESGVVPGGYLRDVVERVTPSLLDARQAGRSSLDDVIDEHARSTARLLADRSTVLAAAVTAGRCAIATVRYQLDGDAPARLLDTIADVGERPTTPADRPDQAGRRGRTAR